MRGVSAEQMAEIDRKAQEEYGIPQMVLMENAGRTVAEIIISDVYSMKEESIAIFCGKGNNGGDGFVTARYLANIGPKDLIIYIYSMVSIRSGAAKSNYEIIKKMGLDIRSIDEYLEDSEKSSKFTICIDSIFGTGFKGELPEPISRISESIDAKKLRLYSVDIPSGLDSTTGKASANCFKAYKTISFGLPKKGFYIDSGPRVCGNVEVRNIGFPDELLKEYR